MVGIRELWLNKNRLTTLPDALAELVMLEELYLHENKLESLPQFMGRWTV